jgi:hypothetical protein
MITVSTQPPKEPEMPPSSSPRTKEIVIPTMPTVRDLGAVEEARELVPPERIGAEQIDPPWRVDAEEVDIRRNHAEERIRIAPDKEPERLFLGRDVLVAKGARIGQPRLPDDRQDAKLPLGIDPAKALRRVIVPAAIHFLLRVRRHERGEGRERVEREQQDPAGDRQRTLLQLAPEDPRGRLWRRLSHR